MRKLSNIDVTGVPEGKIEIMVQKQFYRANKQE